MPIIHHIVMVSGQPPIVFVHGFACAHSDWDRQVAHFAPPHVTIAVEHEQCGEVPCAVIT